MLYLWDMRRQPVEEAVADYYNSLYSEEETAAPGPDPLLEELVAGVVAKAPELDALIAKHAANWRMDRMPAVDRNVLRLAVYEMTFHGTPAPVAIDQALELARRFCGDESVGFVNGVLDAVRKGQASRPGNVSVIPEAPPRGE